MSNCEVLTIKRVTGWDLVFDAARATMGKIMAEKEPTDKWKKEAMQSPHSQIRCLQYFIQVQCPYYVQGHITRHHEGIQFFCGSQRNDRQDKYDRRAARQDTPVLMSFLVNAEALKFISRRRLCMKADPATRELWQAVVDAVRTIDPIVADFCKPECFWNNGVCDEFKPCGLCPKREV